MSHGRVVSILALATLVGASSVCAQDEEVTEVREVDISDAPPVAEDACFNVRDIRNFDAVDDRHLIVEGRRDEFFLLTMFGTCFSLRNANGIAISNDFSRVCSNSSARIVYRDFGRMQSCRIRTVESVDSEAAAEQIIELRRQE